MSVVYRTKQGDVLDAIVCKQYNGQSGALEQVLEANKGLAAQGAVLPMGVLVTLPDLPKPQAVESVHLW